jgi:hypothetical protein
MFDPMALKRPEIVTDTRTFTDPAQPGLELTLTANGSPDYAVQVHMKELGDAYAAKHIGKFPVMVDGRKVDVTPSLCSLIASITVMVVKTDEIKDWDFPQWAAIAVAMPKAFGEIVDWCAKLAAPSKRTVGENEEAKVPND